MTRVKQLVHDVATARERFLAAVGAPTPEQASFRPTPDGWSLGEIVEHLVLAEQGGINKIWAALDAQRRGRPTWEGELVHRGLPIEVIVERTWAARERAPDVAVPRWGGPVAYWTAALRSCQPLLDALGRELRDEELEAVVYPHALSGPLDARQRMEFLRFHLDRHRGQVERLRGSHGFPPDGHPA